MHALSQLIRLKWILFFALGIRMSNLVDSGGEAKTVIQNSLCMLNGSIEIRRSKKLYHGDKVSFGSSVDLDVSTMVNEKGYILKPKIKKTKPLPKIDSEGNLEFGGRYRSEEWRLERKAKKIDRKTKNRESK
jgi:ribosome-associated protein YbcJ (S4-like RNA binding protein)